MKIRVKIISVNDYKKEGILGVFGQDNFKMRIFIKVNIEDSFRRFFLTRYLIYPHSYKIKSISLDKDYYWIEIDLDDRAYEIIMSDVES